MTYDPKAPDYNGIEIPADLIELVEQLAKSTHDAWSRQRLAEGWRYGQHRDDFKKEHPGLVPYQDLPESEKEYDRKISLETIKTILAWGYRIQSPSSSMAAPAGCTPTAPGEVTAFQTLFDDLPRLDLNQSLELWQTIRSGGGSFPEGIYRDLGHHLLRLGEPLLAYDIVSEGLTAWPQNTRLRQLLALALLRSGAREQALALLQKLYDEGRHDEETLGLMARACKDLAIQATDLTEKTKQWRRAYEIYASTFANTGGYWTGINAATIARCLGEREKAEALAAKVAAQCLQELSRKPGDGGERYWLEATLGEAALIREQWDEAIHWYTKAAQTAARRYGDQASTRRNARILFDAIDLDLSLRERLESCFRIPAVVVFAGHMIDQPGRLRRRFPAYLAEQVSQKIAETLERLEARIGFSSAACGADILFLEAMLAREGEINVVLPFIPGAFKKTSVDIIPGADWSRRFDQVLARATRTIIASDNRSSGNEVTYQYANLLQDGLAILRAKMLDTEVIPLVVWDGQEGDSPGGTASLVQHWRAHGLEPVIIDIAGLLTAAPEPTCAALTDPPGQRRVALVSAAPDACTQEIKAMLFADVVGSSRITEEQVPAFVEYFMGAVHDLIAASPHKPVLANTWGDALYGVFTSVQDAGNFALQLRDRIGATDWQARGLPQDVNLRISLHAGPVYSCQEPGFRELRYAGSHVVRAARIEPITPPGQVYASQQFAALTSAQRVRDFICEYVGQIPLPKHSGIIPLYLVRRGRP